MKKIAIPTKNLRIDSHFGQADEFSVFTINGNSISDIEKVISDQGCGCRSNIIAQLKEKGVTVMLAGHMGEGALRKLQYAGMEVIRGCTGKADHVVRDYIKGNLSDNGELCESHGLHHH